MRYSIILNMNPFQMHICGHTHALNTHNIIPLPPLSEFKLYTCYPDILNTAPGAALPHFSSISINPCTKWNIWLKLVIGR